MTSRPSKPSANFEPFSITGPEDLAAASKEAYIEASRRMEWEIRVLRAAVAVLVSIVVVLLVFVIGNFLKRGNQILAMGCGENDANCGTVDNPLDPGVMVNAHPDEDIKCAKVDINNCAKYPQCFPHHYTEECFGYVCTKQPSFNQNLLGQSVCKGAQEIDCMATDEGETAEVPEANQYPPYGRNMLISSDGISNNNLRHAFRHLVLQLPAEVWRHGRGTEVLKKAQSRTVDYIKGKKFHEPELYDGLNLLIIADACGFKEDDVLRNGLAKVWPCEDASLALAELGFSKEQLSNRIYLFDLTSNHYKGLAAEQKAELTQIRKDVLSLNNGSPKEKYLIPDRDGKSLTDRIREYVEKYTLEEKLAKIQDADIIAVNGGNPDWVTFCVTGMSEQIKDALLQKVASEKTVYIGQSAGGMAALNDIGMSNSAFAKFQDNLFGCMEGRNMKNLFGLALMARCGMRPHFHLGWQQGINAYERAKGIRIVRIRDGEGMMCLNGKCKMVGQAHECHYVWDPRGAQKYGSTCTIMQAIPHQEGSARQKRQACSNGELKDRLF